MLSKKKIGLLVCMNLIFACVVLFLCVTHDDPILSPSQMTSIRGGLDFPCIKTDEGQLPDPCETFLVVFCIEEEHVGTISRYNKCENTTNDPGCIVNKAREWKYKRVCEQNLVGIPTPWGDIEFVPAGCKEHEVRNVDEYASCLED